MSRAVPAVDVDVVVVVVDGVDAARAKANETVMGAPPVTGDGVAVTDCSETVGSSVRTADGRGVEVMIVLLVPSEMDETVPLVDN